jgi:hypothetical protein
MEYFSCGQKTERVKTVVLSTSILRSFVKKTVCDDRNIALKLKVEEINVVSTIIHADIGVC